MDQNRNPFNPGAGVRPPELAGRQDALDGAALTLSRIKHGRYERSRIFVGLRGVGKTVILQSIRRKAEDLGYFVDLLEAQDGQSLANLLTPTLRTALLQMDAYAKGLDAVKRGLRVFRSFIGNVRINVGGAALTIDVDPEPGIADSGDLERDFSDLLAAVGEAAKAARRPVALLIDELQYLGRADLATLFRAVHHITQKELPLAIFAAGLPQLTSMAGDAKSYAERMFEFYPLESLSESDARNAIRSPIEVEGAHITDSALAEIVARTHGYPYFLQEWGYNAWAVAKGSEILDEDAKEATARSIAKLDQSFFRVRFDRTTFAERDYMRAMAGLGDGPHRTADVAARAKRKPRSLGPVRDSLIKKGMIYAPGHGTIAFTVPLFDEFMLREMD